MPHFFCRKLTFFYRKAISTVVLLCFSLFTVVGPAGSQTISLPNFGLTTPFQPPVLRGMTVHPENPLLFDFIVDRGQDKIGNDLLKDESTKLIKYFLTSMTIPDKDAWVNLSPFEKDRIIPDALGQTEMGRQMLEQDYVLKQLAASLTNPDTELGKKYWDEVNKAKTLDVGGWTLEKTASVQPPATSDFNKVWIVPDGATVVEKDGFAYITESKLTVMLDEEYQAVCADSTVGAYCNTPLQKNTGSSAVSISTQVFRQRILPKLIEEVNTGKNFAATRQVYQSVILAAWYKKALKDSLLGKIYADKSKIAGVETDVKDIKQKVYEQYLEAFKKGAYNIIKEDAGPDGELIPRKYFSGGSIMASSPTVVSTPAAVAGVKRAIDVAGNKIALVAASTVETLAESDAIVASAAVRESDTLQDPARRDFLKKALAMGAAGSLGPLLTPTADVFAQGVGEISNPRLSANRMMILSELEMFNSSTASDEFKASVRADLEDLFKKEGYGLIPFYNKFDPDKPVVLFIHGASREGGAAKFIDALALYHKDANLLAYQFDDSKPLEQIAKELGDQWKNLNINNSNAIVVAHSYGTVVFRQVVNEDPDLFRKTAVIEIAPTYGGSRYAFRYGDGKFAEIATELLGYKTISEAQYPSGTRQNKLFSQEATAKLDFKYRLVFLVEEDANNPKQKPESEMSAEETNFSANFQRGLKGADQVIYLNGEATHGNAPLNDEFLKALGNSIQTASSSSVDNASIASNELTTVLRGDEYGIYQKDGENGVLYFIADNTRRYARLENILRLLNFEDLPFGKVIESGTIQKPLSLRVALDQIAGDIKGFLKESYRSGKQGILDLISSEFDTRRDIPTLWEHITGFYKLSDFDPAPSKSQKPFQILGNIKKLTVNIKETLKGLNKQVAYVKFEALPDGQMMSKSSLWKYSSFDERIDILMDLANTFQKMHEAGIIYNNVNAQSIMVGQKDGKTVALPVDFSQSYLYGYDSPAGQTTSDAIRGEMIELARMINIEIRAQVPFYESSIDGPLEELIDMMTDIYFTRKNIPKDMAEFADWLLEIKEDTAQARDVYDNLERRLSSQRGPGAASSSVGDLKASSTALIEKDSTVGGLDRQVGGIDFDPSKLNLQIKRDGRGVPLPLPEQDLENINIKGLYPVIINILPVNAQTLPILGN